LDEAAQALACVPSWWVGSCFVDMGVDQMIKLPRKIYRCDKCLRLEEFDVGRDGSIHRFAWPESKLCDGTLDPVELIPAQATVWKLAGFEALVELLIYEVQNQLRSLERSDQSRPLAQDEGDEGGETPSNP